MDSHCNGENTDGSDSYRHDKQTDGDGTDLLKACPECDSSRLQFRTVGQNGRYREGEGDYYCKDCEATVEDPVERERKNIRAARHGVAKKLEQADPDDLATDGGTELTVWRCGECGDQVEAEVQPPLPCLNCEPGKNTWQRMETDGGIEAPDKVIERPGFSADIGLLEASGRAVFATRKTDQWEGRYSLPADYLDQLAMWWLQQRRDAGTLSVGLSDAGPELSGFLTGQEMHAKQGGER